MTPRTIELTEYQATRIPHSELSHELGQQLWQTYGSKGINVEFPAPPTDHKWELTSQGYVGHIPLSPDVSLRLQPKVPLGNLFAMLEYAYNLKSFRFLEGQSQCHNLEDFYERLASVLAGRILDRTRQGLYRTYIHKTERLTCLRGRLDIPHQIRRPWDIKPKCHYQEQTADIEDNQILLWTLRQITHHGIIREEVSTIVRRTYRGLQGTISLIPCHPRICQGRTYHRLNQDYQTLHALCHFFLDQTGPSLQQGNQGMLPFLVNMNQLFESCVAAWLQAHHSEVLELHGLQLKVQERVHLSHEHAIYFDIDLVLIDIAAGAVRYVLDTKYKATKTPSTSDIQQAIAYAETQGTTEAVLVYPQALTQPLDTRPNKIRVRSLTFDISGNIDEGGRAFVQSLLA
ncbi:McrC family protein [Leptolyngbya sp. PCC 6406]|uniref:McrC family protein n=1 Tax=Leptolyngbya sp. PCC 6406 TaxID=1173264 RepID=UPI0002ACDCB6|nr:McrBC 5-methylcytosine restriction system component [Leptolyngbya sp. PCC 6406]